MFGDLENMPVVSESVYSACHRSTKGNLRC